MNVNLFSHLEKPTYQALLFIALTPVVILLFKPTDAEAAWQLAAYIVGLFLVINCIMIAFSASPWRYFLVSLGVGLGYLICIALILSILISILQLKKSEESAMAFLIWIYQPLGLLLMLLIKWCMQWIFTN
jgi:hypothetical protein